MADKTNASQAQKAPGDISKKEAVRQALQALGKEATPSQLHKHIKDSYGIEMSLKHISVEKTKILTAASKSKPAPAKATPAKSPAKQPTAQKPVVRKEASGKAAIPPADRTQGISLTDIETVKDLVERVGASSLKKLIEVMAR